MLCKQWSRKACLTPVGSAAEFVGAPAVASPALQAAFTAEDMLRDSRLRARAAQDRLEVQVSLKEAWKIAAEEPGHYVYFGVRYLAHLHASGTLRCTCVASGTGAVGRAVGRLCTM